MIRLCHPMRERRSLWESWRLLHDDSPWLDIEEPDEGGAEDEPSLPTAA